MEKDRTELTPESQKLKVNSVRHWHVTESDAGYLPESEPYTSIDAGSALDALAHLLKDWAELDPERSNAVHAEAIAELYCTCRDGGRPAEHYDALTAVENGRGICEEFERVFELVECPQKDCLKYCPDDECRTETPVTDTDTHCWCCGSRFVEWQECSWLA